MNDGTIDQLLDALDAKARERPYPPQGLPIWGDGSEREMYRLIVREWLVSASPEAQR